MHEELNCKLVETVKNERMYHSSAEQILDYISIAGIDKLFRKEGSKYYHLEDSEWVSVSKARVINI